MNTVSITAAREHLDELCESVAATSEPVVIECANGPSVVVLPVSAIFADIPEPAPGSARANEDTAVNEAEMRRLLYAALDSKDDEGPTITTSFEELCKAVGADANQL